MAERRRGGDGPRAGQSLHDEYTRRHREWLFRRSRAATLSAAWWVPLLAVVALAVGEVTHFGMFGVLVFGLGLAGTLDVLFRRPGSLLRVQARAAAEEGTGRHLEQVGVRSGQVALHDRMYVGDAGGGPFEVEHLVFSSTGVFLIDSKQWSGSKVQLFGAALYVNQKSQADLVKEMKARAKRIGTALTEVGQADEQVGIVTVYPVLVAHMPDMKGLPRTINGVLLITPAQIPSVLASPGFRWNHSTAKGLAAAAEGLFVPKDRWNEDLTASV